ncbi:MAG: hypothetical protein ABW277_28035 [Longimicrobiaceae bacterium]
MKIILFDLGDTLEHEGVLLPGAKQTLECLRELRDGAGEAVILALASDFDMPEEPQQVQVIRQRYYGILDRLGIRSFFEPVDTRVTLSTDVGVFKPDELLFREVLARSGGSATFRDVVFVTENPDHVSAARKLGMLAIHFGGPGQVSGEVDRLVDLVPRIREMIGV